MTGVSWGAWCARSGNCAVATPPTISTPTIDRIISAARKRGALGGKVCGAGGGGCVALLIEPEARVAVEAAVTSSGGTVLPLRIDREGVRAGVDSSAGQDSAPLISWERI